MLSRLVETRGRRKVIVNRLVYFLMWEMRLVHLDTTYSTHELFVEFLYHYFQCPSLKKKGVGVGGVQALMAVLLFIHA